MLTEIPIFDGHNDTLLRLHLAENEQVNSFFERSKLGHLDMPRAREGGMAGGFFAAFVPPDYPVERDIIVNDKGYEIPLPEPPSLAEAQALTTALLAWLHRLERSSAGTLKVVRTVQELERCLKDGVFAAVFHLEGAEAIDPELEMLEVLYQAGLRSLGPVWSRPNRFGTGVPFKIPSSPDVGPGLTDLGKGLVKRCNELGVLVDLSHLNERGFWDVAALATAPLVATHSNAHALCPAARNLTDAQLVAVRETSGVVGVNFSVTELRVDGYHDADTPLEVIVRHIDYLVDKLGVDGVAFGSDFDGATLPYALKDVTGFPKLISALRRHGYGDATLCKLCFENWLACCGAPGRFEQAFTVLAFSSLTEDLYCYACRRPEYRISERQAELWGGTKRNEYVYSYGLACNSLSMVRDVPSPPTSLKPSLS